jgi:anti-anti-sigma factor
LRDEDKFPTMRFLTCPACGHAYTASLSGEDSCPRCQASVRQGRSQAPRVRRTQQGSHILFTVAGPIYKIQELEDLKFEIDRALKETPDSIAFHLEGASYLDSSMLAQLVRTLQEMTRRGKATFLITADAHVLESLQVVDLDRVLTVIPSLEAYQAGLA